MTFAPRERPGADITLTPLIDILFIVLLFLVLTATFSNQSVLRISLPMAGTGERDVTDPEAVRILVDAAGNLEMNGQLLTLPEIGRRLRAMPDKNLARVTVAADATTEHGSVIEVIDQVRRAGIFRLNIETWAAPGAGER